MRNSTETLLYWVLILLLVLLVLVLLPIVLPILISLLFVGGIGLFIGFPIILIALVVWAIVSSYKFIKRKRDNELWEVDEYIRNLPYEYRDYAMAVLDEDGLTDYDRRVKEVVKRYKKRLVLLWACVLLFITGVVLLAYPIVYGGGG